MQESHSKEIYLSDISPQAFKGKKYLEEFLCDRFLALLEYLEKGTLPLSQNILKELMVYSEKILLKRLKEYCEKTLIQEITKQNAVELYELSKISGAEELREATLQMMGNNLSYFADQLASFLAKESEKKK